MNHKISNKGFSLIELMISLALGLIVIAAVIAVFLSTSRTANATSILSRAQESSRFAVQYIGRELRTAGYAYVQEGDQSGGGVAGGNAVSTDFIFPADSVFTTVGQVLVGTDNSTAAGVLAGSDTISVRYSGSLKTDLVDCQDATVAPFVASTIRLFVNASNDLVCTVNGGAQVVLIEDIANMQLQYGVDTNNNGSTDSYVAASAVSDWLEPVSVRLQLTIDSNNADVNDRVVTSVIALRNQLL